MLHYKTQVDTEQPTAQVYKPKIPRSDNVNTKEQLYV